MEIILSSSKRGYGLKELMSSDTEEYWNSDDELPHSITVSFFKKTYVYSINLLLLYSSDESYTPEKIAMYYRRANKRIVDHYEPEPFNAKDELNRNLCNTSNYPKLAEKEEDLISKTFTFKEPEGLISLEVNDFVFDLHIVVLNNHSDGKDSHIRQLKIMSSPTEQILYDTNKFF